MLGLISSEETKRFWSANTRRRIFYNYPNGTAPLTGFLSMQDTKEETPIQEFGWWEKRWLAVNTTIMTGPTANTAFYAAGGTVPLANPFNPNVVTNDAPPLAIRVYVADASNFQINNSIGIFGLSLTGGFTDNLTGKVTAVGITNNHVADYIEFLASGPCTATIINGTAATNLTQFLFFMGSSYAEGTRTDSGRTEYPSRIMNYTQIHKTRFDLTRDALKNPLQYDKSGAYEDALKTNGIDHLTGLEMTLFFQDRLATTEVVKGKQVSRYQSGGLMWFLKQWELGSKQAGGEFNYGQPNVTNVDWHDAYTKRIIRLNGATISKSEFTELNSRAFNKTNSLDWCKLVLCGQGYLNKVAEHFEKQMTFTSTRDEGFKGFNFELVMHKTNAGTVYYKVHPLFNNVYNFMYNSAFYIDPGYLRWLPFKDTDTDVISGVQENDEDIRADMYITEGGPEFAFPEAHMLVDQLGGITL